MDRLVDLVFSPSAFYLAPIAVLVMATHAALHKSVNIRIVATFLLTAGAFLSLSGTWFYLTQVSRDGMALLLVARGGSGFVSRWLNQFWPIGLLGMTFILIVVALTAYSSDRRKPMS